MLGSVLNRLLVLFVCGAIACGVGRSPEQAPPADPDNEVVHWTCPMHPSVEEAAQTPCPICRMDLTPVTRGELQSGAVVIDALRRQAFGVRLAKAEVQPLVREVRGSGTVVWDDNRTYDLTIRAMGWVEQMKVYETGTVVRRGDVIARIYSPDLYNAQREFLAHRSSNRAEEKRERLELLGYQTSQIEALLQSRIANEVVTIRSPVSGVVTELNAVKGAHLMEGTRLAQIAETDPVWVEVGFSQGDAGFLKTGDPVRVRVPGSETEIEGTLDRVEPWVDPSDRRMRARATIENPNGALLGNAIVEAVVQVDLGEALAIPADAVIHSGERRIVFVDRGQDRLVPQEVKLGPKGGERVAVVEGLKPGDEVVRSGVFLVAAESRLRAAETYWGAPDGDP